MSRTSILGAPLNIASHLAVMAARQPHTPAVFASAGRSRSGRTRYLHLTYRQLHEDSERIARGLAIAGIARGTRAVVMVRPGLDFFALIFALFRSGVVPVLIDPGIGLRSIAQCCREAEPEVFIGIPKALYAQRVLGWGRATVRRRIVVAPGRKGAMALDGLRHAGRQDILKHPEPASTPAPSSDALAAAILFTSGSTGPPKGVVYTHAIFEAQVNMLRGLYAIEPGEIDLCTFPLFALFAPALGLTAVVPEMDPTRPARIDPRNIFDAIEDFGVTNLFGSPALLNRLVQGAEASQIRLPTLRRVISAGAPVPAPVIERMARLLEPGAQVYTPYGATESLPVASIGSDEILRETRQSTDRGLGVCVGRPVPPMTVRIITISDEPISTWSDELLVPDGEIGEIVVAGPVVTREYFHRPEATALAKIEDPVRGIFYHRMGDLGRRDAEGRLWFYGRKSHRVVLNDDTLCTIPCEAIFNRHPAVARTALVGVNRGGSIIPVLCVEPVRELSRFDEDDLRSDLIRSGAAFAHTRRIQTFLFHPAFPVDARHNAKIFREKLAIWASRRLP